MQLTVEKLYYTIPLYSGRGALHTLAKYRYFVLDHVTHIQHELDDVGLIKTICCPQTISYFKSLSQPTLTSQCNLSMESNQNV